MPSARAGLQSQFLCSGSSHGIACYAAAVQALQLSILSERGDLGFVDLGVTRRGAACMKSAFVAVNLTRRSPINFASDLPDQQLGCARRDR